MELEKLKEYIDRSEQAPFSKQAKAERKREYHRKYYYIRKRKINAKYNAKVKKQRRKELAMDRRSIERRAQALIHSMRKWAVTNYEAYCYRRHLQEIRASQQYSEKYPRGTVTPFRFRKILKEILIKRLEEYMNPTNEKLKIMCIVGTSGSGKKLASLHLKYKLDANVICSFTTRPPRETEVEGRDHHFINIHPEEKDTLAMTTYGGHLYYALKSQVFGDCTVYVIDEQGLRDLMDVHGDEYRLFKVYLKRDIRKRRKSKVLSERTNRDSERVPFDDDFYDYIIDNNSTKRHLFEEIENIYNTIKNME